jgi:hypothetical protein
MAVAATRAMVFKVPTYEPTEINNHISANGTIRNKVMKKNITLASPVLENILLYPSLFHFD